MIICTPLNKLEFDGDISMMKNRIVDEEIMLVRYYPNYKTTLEWYQDLTLCKQVDNRDTAYDLDFLKVQFTRDYTG